MKTWSLIESCAEFSAISGFIFFFISSSLLFYFRADVPSMFSSVSINRDVDAMIVS